MTDEQLGRWPVSREVPVAWGDMDAFGHVNNTVFLRWFETARIAYFEAVGLAKGDVGPILARATCDYELPITYPDLIMADATVVKFGNTSFTMEYRVHSRRHGKRAAKGEGIVVLYDYARGVKVHLEEALKARIRALESSAATSGPRSGSP